MAPKPTPSDDKPDKASTRRPQRIVLRPLPPLVLQSATNRLTIQLSTSTLAAAKIASRIAPAPNEARPSNGAFGAGSPDRSDHTTAHQEGQSAATKEELQQVVKELREEIAMLRQETKELKDTIHSLNAKMEKRFNELKAQIDRLTQVVRQLLIPKNPSLPSIESHNPSLPASDIPRSAEDTQPTTASAAPPVHLAVNAQLSPAPTSPSHARSILHLPLPSPSASAPVVPPAASDLSPHHSPVKRKSLLVWLSRRGSPAASSSSPDGPSAAASDSAPVKTQSIKGAFSNMIRLKKSTKFAKGK